MINATLDSSLIALLVNLMDVVLILECVFNFLGFGVLHAMKDYIEIMSNVHFGIKDGLMHIYFSYFINCVDIVAVIFLIHDL